MSANPEPLPAAAAASPDAPVVEVAGLECRYGDTVVLSGITFAVHARELFFVLKGKPQNLLLVEFLRWVLQAGQDFVPDTGYLPLSKERLAQGLAAIGGPGAPK